MLMVLSLDGKIGRLDGAILLALFTAYMLHFARASLEEHRRSQGTPTEAPSEGVAVSSTKTVGGLVLVLLSSTVLVLTAISIAEAMEVPTWLIGLTIVAVGTSVPELATSIVAAREGEPDIAVGNVVGSNIFNALLVVGVAAAIGTLSVESFLLVDMAIMLVICVLIIPLLRSDQVLSRREGAMMLAGYAAYICHLVLSG